MTFETQRDRIAKFKSDEILDAALVQLEEVGWRSFHIRDVASRVGVSRQTIYNTFGSRRQLAASMVVRLCGRFLSGAEQAFATDDELHDQWVVAVRDALRQGTDNGALRAMLSAGSDDRFLDLLTRGAEPLVAASRSRLSAAVLRSHPDLNHAAVDAVAESVARLVISNVVLPLHPIEEVAAAIARMATATLDSAAPDGTAGDPWVAWARTTPDSGPPEAATSKDDEPDPVDRVS